MGKSLQDKTLDIEQLCVNVLAHMENDYEITIAGNGCNPCEATPLASEILRILHGPDALKRFGSVVAARARVLRHEQGEE